MARQEEKRPWWERPATAPGEPHYEPEREHLRAELARARRADVTVTAQLQDRRWAGTETPQAAA